MRLRGTTAVATEEGDDDKLPAEVDWVVRFRVVSFMSVCCVLVSSLFLCVYCVCALCRRSVGRSDVANPLQLCHHSLFLVYM